MSLRGVRWLSRAARDPQLCRECWNEDPARLQLVRLGRMFDVVSVQLAFGREVVETLERSSERLGAVAACPPLDTADFFVGPGSRSAVYRMLSQVEHADEVVWYSGSGDGYLAPGPSPLAASAMQWLRAPGHFNLTDVYTLTSAFRRMLVARRCSGQPRPTHPRINLVYPEWEK